MGLPHRQELGCANLCGFKGCAPDLYRDIVHCDVGAGEDVAHCGASEESRLSPVCGQCAAN